MKKNIPTIVRSHVKDLKRRIEQLDAELVEAFWDNGNVLELVPKRSAFIDGFLSEMWNDCFGDEDALALFAVGGYGRGELHPHSDVDLLILRRGRKTRNERVEAFVRELWDLGLDLGISVRTIKECKIEAANDQTVITALTERRLLCGSRALALRLDRALNSNSHWPTRKFVRVKRTEQLQRHEQFGDIEYGLEPNIKNSPGGLRDIQVVGWITKRQFDTSDPKELVSLGILTDREADTLVSGIELLWRIRFALHVLSKRKDDQLSFGYQREIADRFGYTDSDGLLAVERFMRDYYRVVLELREVNDISLQYFDETVLHRGWLSRVKPLNSRFQIHNRYLEVRSDSVFEEYPPALFELFVLMANDTTIRGVRANTIRLIRKNLHLIDDSFRNNAEIGRLFIALLKSPHVVVSQLTRMRRYGILGRYIPQFGQVIGQMQHDLFHIYTVDAHTMMLIRNLRRMLMTEYADHFPLVSEVASQIERIELLYLAGIFHDIGKGRGGNHSSLGAADALDFCTRIGLDQEGKELVGWLVQNHLVMSRTSQRKDTADPKVHYDFARLVQTEERLNYLLVLTVADIQATAPSLWTDWRASLLYTLFFGTQEVLQKGVDIEPETQVLIERRQQAAAQVLEQRSMKDVDLEGLWREIDPGFILSHSPQILASFAEHLSRVDPRQEPLVFALERDSTSSQSQIIEIFISTVNRPRLFVDCVMALSRFNLGIVDARIATSATDLCYDSFVVIPPSDERLNVDRQEQICEYLREILRGERTVQRMRQQRIPRQLREFKLPVRVTFSEDDNVRSTTIEVIAPDRSGLLAVICSVLAEFQLDVITARVSTFGERVEDVFEVKNNDEAPMSDLQKTELRESLIAQISTEVVESAA